MRTWTSPRVASAPQGCLGLLAKRAASADGVQERRAVGRHVAFTRTLATIPDMSSSATGDANGTTINGRAERIRHLLRSILRECTYLPDAVARQWTRQYALDRFRTYSYKAWEKKSDASFELRLRSKEKEARNWVTYLRRANEGERKCLLRVLFMAYGRTGKRRHELMEPLLPKAGDALQELMTESEDHAPLDDAIVENPSESADESDGMDPHEQSLRGNVNAIENPPRESATQSIEPHLTPQLRALLMSQIRATPPNLTRPSPRRLSQDMPSINSWLRPMPQKRVKNMRKRFYATLLERTLPPLPTDEWLRLFDLATGNSEIGPVKRRRQKIVQNDVRNVALETVVTYGKAPTRFLEERSGHAMTSRYMRRLYAELFRQCPLMHWDAEAERWEVIWGAQALSRGHPNSRRKVDSQSAANTGFSTRTIASFRASPGLAEAVD